MPVLPIMVLLIGNYPADRQQSMQRFATMLLQGLTAAGIRAEIIQPQPYLGRIQIAGSFVAKWFGYIDKFVLFPWQLRRRLSASVGVVHICDHSNAVYGAHVRSQPVVISCHDLLAVRGSLGEETDCPASITGRVLQRWIVAGLEKADLLVCASQATLVDAQRLVSRVNGKPKLEVITLGLSYPYRRLPSEEARARLAALSDIDPDTPFVLHVGSNSRRKNRAGVLRIFARCKEKWKGSLVFAGEPLTESLRSLGRQLGVADRIVEVPETRERIARSPLQLRHGVAFPFDVRRFRLAHRRSARLWLSRHLHRSRTDD